MPQVIWPAEHTYIVDCAVELGEITPYEAQVLYLNTPAAHELARALDTHEMGNQHFLRNTARNYLNNLPEKERFVWALRAVDGMAYGINFFMERVEFLLQQKVQQDLGLTEKRNIRWMAEGSDATFVSTTDFPTVHDVGPETVTRFVDNQFHEVKQNLLADLQLLQQAIEWLQKPGARAQARALAEKMGLGASVTEPLPLPSVKLSKLVGPDRKAKKQVRGAIKKVLNLFRTFGMEKNVQMLISGHSVTLAHPDSAFKLEVTPYGGNWLVDKTKNPGGHVPFQLSLLTKEDVFISRLCVLFDKTPVLDQLFALSMFVQTGNEMELLEKANWFGINDYAQAKEALTIHAPALLPKLGKELGVVNGNPRDYREAFELGMLKDRQLMTQWEPYKAPVRQWLRDWLGPVIPTLTQLTNAANTVRLPQMA